ncbi:MAG: aminoacyl-tRNA hydrolase [Candidatus Atribacteria bacterium]|nr:aminoacyl-tRNA hydrolase [Candidatus Atribacteria bacterium]
MNIIVGLGNPGIKYKHSRHNVGFRVVDQFAFKIGDHNLKWKKKFLAHILPFKFLEQDLILVKPQTYMNLSGKAVKEIMTYYHIMPEQLLVIYDDFHLPLGKIRIRRHGSSGGHNGVDSIINSIKSEEFPRLRIGIGNEQLLTNLDYTDFVITSFLSEEERLIETTLTYAVRAVRDILLKGLEFAMREYNSLNLTEESL